jgi:ribonuclease P protein component
VLARENRIRTGADFRNTMKTGVKVSGKATVIYLKRDESQTHARFGFIVSKTVSGAVGRNLIKRRLRSISRELLTNHPSGFDLVIRALPEAKEYEWNRLQKEVLDNAKALFSK